MESLRSIGDLDYPNYELIVVDNGSTDGSFKIIKESLREMNIRSKAIGIEKNLGFTGGNNVAYRARNTESEYVVLLNNDAVPYPESLRKLVEVMENDKKLGSAQGIILNYDGKSIDTAGGFVSELLTSLLFLNGCEPDSLKREIYVSHANGAYAIFRVRAIQKALGTSDRILDDDLFALRDDDLIGFKLWNAGFRIKALPFVAARHKRSSSIGRIGLTSLYLTIRNQLILNEISNSRYKLLIDLIIVRRFRIPLSIKLGNLSVRNPDSRRAVQLRVVQKAIFDGKRIGRVKMTLGDTIDIYKAPIVRVNPSVGILGFAIPSRILFGETLKELAKYHYYI